MRMIQQRKGDTGSPARFRSERFFQNGGDWYFHTREGTVEGPFQYRLAAENRLAEYIRVMASGWLSDDSPLAIEPFN
jgi:hypothetical protein